MVSSDSVPGPEPVDPVYAALFRPEDDAEPVLEAPDPQDEQDDDPMFEQVLDPVVDPRIEELPDPDSHPASVRGPAVEPVSDLVVVPRVAPSAEPSEAVVTGRLFRSQGVVGNQVAVLALTSDHGGRLRTLARTSDDGSMEPVASNGPGSESTPSVEKPARRSRRTASRSAHREPGHRSRAISAGAVYIVVFGTTVLVAFANALISGGSIGWPTGLALLVSSVYCALTVRRDDDVVVIFTPPIAFFVAAITAGQFFRGPSGGGLLNRAQLAFFTLADNWYWVIGATLAAAVIVIVRRRRS